MRAFMKLAIATVGLFGLLAGFCSTAYADITQFQIGRLVVDQLLSDIDSTVLQPGARRTGFDWPVLDPWYGELIFSRIMLTVRIKSLEECKLP